MKKNKMVTQMVQAWRKSGQLVFVFCKDNYQEYGYASPQSMSSAIHKRVGSTKQKKVIPGERRLKLLEKYWIK